MKKFLFNLTFYPLFVFVTLGMPAVLVLPLLLLRAAAGERVTMRCLRWWIMVYGLIVVRGLLFPFVRIEHKRPGKKPERACIYVCNHRAASDAFLMALLGRELVQVVNMWPFKIPVLGWIAKRAGYLSVRTMPFEEFSARASRFLEEGVSIVAFPEGSRSAEQEMHQFNGAVLRVAQTAKVPVIPVCISGNDRIPEKGTNVFNPGTIQVHELPALEWESFKDMTPFKLKNYVRDLIQSEYERLHGSLSKS